MKIRRMKSFRKLLLLIPLLLAGASAFAQQDGYDVFVPISKYITQGNVEALSAWFDDTLEVTILSKGGDASKPQAKQIVKSFFDSYTPRSFVITHKAGKGNMKYALADLKAGGETFRVTIFVTCRKNSYLIQQIKVDRP